MIEGYARRDSGAANLILSNDAHALAATPGARGDGRRIRRYRRAEGHDLPRHEPSGRVENHPRRDPAAILRYAQDGARRDLLRTGRNDRPRDVSVDRRDREQCPDSSAIRRSRPRPRLLVSPWHITSRRYISGIVRDSRWASRTRSPRLRTQRRSTRRTLSFNTAGAQFHSRAGRPLVRNEWDGQAIRCSELRLWWIWKRRKYQRDIPRNRCTLIGESHGRDLHITRHREVLDHAAHRHGPCTRQFNRHRRQRPRRALISLLDLIGGLPELEDQIGGAMVGTSGQARAEYVATAVRDLQIVST